MQENSVTSWIAISRVSIMYTLFVIRVPWCNNHYRQNYLQRSTILHVVWKLVTTRCIDHDVGGAACGSHEACWGGHHECVCKWSKVQILLCCCSQSHWEHDCHSCIICDGQGKHSCCNIGTGNEPKLQTHTSIQVLVQQYWNKLSMLPGGQRSDQPKTIKADLQPFTTTVCSGNMNES